MLERRRVGMIIAITSTGENLDSSFDERFGRSQYFIFFDTQSNSFKAKENKKNLQASQGAGIQSAQCIIDEGAEILITGNCGPKAFQFLRMVGIEVYLTKASTAKEALQHYQDGKLHPLKEANVEGHWG